MKFVLLVYQIIVFTFINCYSQTLNRKWHIHPPLPIELILSANFGELRASSFHTGVDFKTNQQENIPVLAIDDGYISRVAISKTGYGKAVYITHNNGYTSVYAHLRDFYPELSKFIKDKQYELKSYELNLYPSENKFIIKKGQVIGYSGNTGNSFGPHLHFEIRNNNEEPLNPLIFFPAINDLFYPIIKKVWIYEFSNFICNKEKRVFSITPVIKNGKYYLPDTIYIDGKIGIGIEAYDNINSKNICGIYSIDMYSNNIKIYSVKFDKISFYEQKFYKGFIDYKRLIQEKNRIYKLFVDKNNNLSLYAYLSDDKGIISITNDDINKVKLVLKDFSGRQAILEFFIKLKNINFNDLNNKENFGNYDYYDSILFSKDYSIHFDECNVYIPSYSLFDNICFTYKKFLDNRYLSNIHEIGNIYDPIIDKITIEILPIKECSMVNKMLIAEITNDNITKVYKAEKTKEGLFKAVVDNFGKYVLLVDTLAPECIPEKYSSNISYKENDTISFIIKDNLSEISKYEAYIDDNWALLEYDLKNNRVFYRIDKYKIEKNKIHKLIIYLEDVVKNRSKFEYYFKY